MRLLGIPYCNYDAKAFEALGFRVCDEKAFEGLGLREFH